MNATEYQKLAARTLIDGPGRDIPDEQIMAVWNALGLAGEVGEVVEVVKKYVFHGHALDLVMLQKELGDVLWYVAGMCTVLGLDMSTVMQANINKLMSRYPEGFSSENSINRVE